MDCILKCYFAVRDTIWKKQDKDKVAPVNWFNYKQEPTVTKQEQPHTVSNSDSDRELWPVNCFASCNKANINMFSS